MVKLPTRGADVLRLGQGKAGEEWVRLVAENGVYRDGGGLYLYVTNNGAGKSWLFRYTHNGKPQSMTLGSYHRGVTLEEARRRANEANAWLYEGKDPKKEREEKRQVEAKKAAQPHLVWHFADIYKETAIKDMPNRRSQLAAERAVEIVLKKIGSASVKLYERDTRALVRDSGLFDLWRTNRPTGRQVRQALSGIFNMAAIDLLDRNPTDAKYMKLALPRAKYRAKPRASIGWEDVPRFLALLRQLRDGDDIKLSTAALLLEMIVFSGVRPQEAFKAQWKEIKGDTWEVPPEHLKEETDKMRPIPLTAPMLVLLDRARTLRVNPSDDEALIFPPVRNPEGKYGKFYRSGPTDAIAAMKWDGDEVQPHGFRNTLQDWGEEKGKDSLLIDRQLDHVPKKGTSIRERYSHMVRQEAKDRSLVGRRGLMADYANEIDPPRTDDDKKVVKLRAS
jgi:Arm DNA-binding domain